MPLAIRMWSFQHLKSWKLAESIPTVQHQGLVQPSTYMTVMEKSSKPFKALKIGWRSEEFRKFKLLGHTAAIVSTRKETFGEVAVFAGTPCTSFKSSELLRRTTNIQQSSKGSSKNQEDFYDKYFFRSVKYFPICPSWRNDGQSSHHVLLFSIKGISLFCQNLLKIEKYTIYTNINHQYVVILLYCYVWKSICGFGQC